MEREEEKEKDKEKERNRRGSGERKREREKNIRDGIDTKSHQFAAEVAHSEKVITERDSNRFFKERKRRSRNVRKQSNVWRRRRRKGGKGGEDSTVGGVVLLDELLDALWRCQLTTRHKFVKCNRLYGD